MTILTRIRKSDLCRIPVSLLAIFLLILPPGLMPAQSPGWWQSRGVLKAGAPADDYAVINQGQLKNLVRAAMQEMNSLPSVGAGKELEDLVASWATPTAHTDDYAAVNNGQLKALAQIVYNRLFVIGFASSYPWAGSSRQQDDYALANIGQAKNLFAFDLSKDTNSVGIPDWWRSKYGLVLNSPSDASAVAPGGVTYLQKYQMGLNPQAADTDEDGYDDSVEIERGTDPLNSDSHPPALVEQQLFWRTQWRWILYDFQEYLDRPPSQSFGEYYLWARLLERLERVDAKIPFASLATKLDKEVPYTTDFTDIFRLEPIREDECTGFYAGGWIAATHYPSANMEGYTGDVFQRVVYLTTHPAPTEDITRKMIKVTKRTIDGGDPVYTVEPVTVTIPAGETKSAPLNLGPVFTTNPTSGNHTEYVEVSLLPIKLKIWNGQDSKDPVLEDKKYSVGAFTVANLNDDDGVGDGKPDKDRTTVTKEKDLMQLYVGGHAGVQGRVKLTVKSGSVEFWEDKTKKTAIPLQNGAVFFNIPAAGMNKTLWVEATATSGTVRDIEIWEGYENAQGNLTDGTDKVRATAVWATRTGMKNTAADPLWADIVDPFKANFTKQTQKFGKNFTNPSGKINYAIGFEFTVQPTGIASEKDVLFEVTRQKQTQVWFVLNGKVFQNDPLTPFPPANTPDLANDDGPAPAGFMKSVQNIPKKHHIYSIDAPGGMGLAVIPGVTQYVERKNFYEFVRVSFNGTRPSGNTNEGSRCSPKEPWHMDMWLEPQGGVFGEKAGKLNEVDLGHVPIGNPPTP